jgi:hypothetical protein
MLASPKQQTASSTVMGLPQHVRSAASDSTIISIKKLTAY